MLRTGCIATGALVMQYSSKSIIIQTLIVFLFFVGWQLVGSLKVVSPLFLAVPSQILSGSWFSDFPQFIPYFQVTVSEVAATLGLAALIGIAGGMILGSNDFVYRILEPFLAWGYSIPKIIFFPLFILLFGLGSLPVIAQATVNAVFVFLLNTTTGVRGVEWDLLKLSKSLGMNRFQRYRKIILPSMIPVEFSAIRLGLIHAVIGVLLAEVIMSSLGAGMLIDNLSYTFHVVQLYSVISLISVVMIALNFVLLRIERRLTFWRV